MKNNKETPWILGLVLLCFCMRAPMSVVGPLVAQIKKTLQLNSALSGMLTTIPLLIFALISPAVGSLLHRIGMKNLFLICILSIFTGILMRSYCGFWGLLAGTAFLGFGIGILNVLIPVWIRRDFPERIGPVMGIYSTSMTALSALAAGFCVAMSAHLNGWQNAMAVFAVLPALAFTFWLFLKLPEQPSDAVEKSGGSLLTAARHFSNWCVALFMGLQSFLFFALIAWMPSMLAEKGFSAGSSGMMVLLFQMVSLITNFLMPVWFQRYPSRRRELAVSGAAVYAAGLLFLLLSKTAPAAITGVILLGLASGLSLSFVLTVIAVKGRSGAETVGLSSFSQCAGYLIAAPAPALLGALYDAASSFTVPLILMIVLCIPLGIFGMYSIQNIK